MPERIERLRATLAELESELRDLPDVSAAQRAVLEEAITEIRSVLRRTESAEDESELDDGDEPVDGRWREAVADFEVSHPQVAGLLSRVINALAQIGI